VAVLVIDSLAVGLLFGVYSRVQSLVPDDGSLGQYRPAETTRLYAKDGTLLATLFDENRQVVALSEMPKWLKEATIAIEDQRFADHPGVDLRGIARALRANLGGASMQGASTITMQLAREVSLSKSRTMSRKLREVILALRIERRYSKDEILGLYMNQICYGHRAYGVVAAADTLFGKKLDQLTLGECALIAGLAKNPEGYSPVKHPEASAQRRDVVLRKMWELGYITQAQDDEAKAEPVVTRRGGGEAWKRYNYRAPWFTTYVVDQLVARYGQQTVYGGGLQVYTTIDLNLQSYAQGVLDEALQGLRRKRADRGAVVALDPRTGAILTMVGGTDFRRDEFNAASQAYRQPGSGFKPIVYTTAMERVGLTPGDVYSGAPATFRGYWGVYSPQNFSAGQGGSYSIASALAQSVNLVAVRVIIKTGAHNVIEQAHKMGIDTGAKRLRPYPSLALGAGEVTPLELAQAYCAFANGGFRVEAHGIETITDSRGSPLFRHAPNPVRVMSPRTYTYMNQMLQGVVANGTGRPAQISSPSGGKTGTTNQAKDVWFNGITPGFVGTVWIGNEDNARMWGASGAAFCAPLWRRIALKHRELARDAGRPWPEAFPQPGTAGPGGVTSISAEAAAEQAKEEKAAEEGKAPTPATATPERPKDPPKGNPNEPPGSPARDPRPETPDSGGPSVVHPEPGHGKPEPERPTRPEPGPAPDPGAKPPPGNPTPGPAPEPGE
jgi:penicillin-binding protein 1A